MTVSYLSSLPVKFSVLGWIWKVMCVWRGSAYKLLWKSLLFYTCLWYALMFAMQTIIPLDYRDRIRNLMLVTRSYQGSTRTLLSFMLVYYYQQIYARAKAMFFSIPWPDSAFYMVNCMITADSEKGRLLRATIFRYILASIFLCFHGCSSMFSGAYSDPFRSLRKLALLTSEEVEQLEARFLEYPYLGELMFVPLVWAHQTLMEAVSDGMVCPAVLGGPSNDNAVATLCEMLKAQRVSCAALLFQAYLPFPLLLSQLVTLVTYLYVLLVIFSQQNAAPSEPFFYFPIFTCIEIIVFVGALRVGQVYSNPLGSDDDDYELVSFFNRNLRLAQIYGLYGGGGQHQAHEYDFHHQRPPLRCLAAEQQHILATTPVQFYSPSDSMRTPVGLKKERRSWSAATLPCSSPLLSAGDDAISGIAGTAASPLLGESTLQR